MKKTIKSLVILSLVLSMICSSIVINPVEASVPELKWRDTVDEYGYPMQVLDMTTEELRAYQISQLKKKYEYNTMQRSSGYTYEYDHVDDLFDSGDGVTQKLLVGKQYDWKQRDTLNCPLTLSFELKGSYKSLEASLSLTATTSETYNFENYENCLGLFARITTTKYKITKKDKYTGAVISVTYENFMSTMSKTVRKIYNKESNKISYQNGDDWHDAKMLKTSLTSPPTSNNDITDATTSVFY